MCNYIIYCVYIKVVNTISVSAGIYYTGMYTDIEKSTFHTGLNTSHPAILANFGQYWPVPGDTEKSYLLIYLFF